MTSPAAIPYLGPDPTVAAELAPRKYVSDQLPGLTTTQVDDRINAGLTGKVAKTYVDTQDALNATAAYVAAGDATRLKLADRDVANGVLALGPSGKAAASRFNVATTQRWPQGFWTPSAYAGASLITAESTLYPISISDPGFAYKLLVYGMVDANVSATTEFPVITVRQGNATTGTVIARGDGAAESYNFSVSYGDDFNSGTLDATKWATVPTTTGPLPNISVDATHVYQVPFSRAASQWIGQQPATDKHYISARVVADAFGDSVMFMSGNAAWTQWVALFVNRASPGGVGYIYSGISPNLDLGAAGSVQRASFNAGATDGGWFSQIVSLDYDPPSNTYTFRNNPVWTNGVADAGSFRCSWQDTGNAISHGPNFRRSVLSTNQSANNSPFFGMGWDDWSIGEPASNPASAPVSVMPVNYASQSVLTGATTLYVRINRSGSAANVGASTTYPKLVAYAVPA